MRPERTENTASYVYASESEVRLTQEAVPRPGRAAAFRSVTDITKAARCWYLLPKHSLTNASTTAHTPPPTKKKRARTHTQTHRHTHTHRHTDTQTRRHADTQTSRHADTQTRRHADTQTRRHADTQTRRHADTHTHPHTHPHTRRLDCLVILAGFGGLTVGFQFSAYCE